MGQVYTVSSGNSQKQFTGVSNDTLKPVLLDVQALSPTTVELTFNKAVRIESGSFQVSVAIGISNDYKLDNIKYSGKTKLIMTTNEMHSMTLYQVDVSGLTDWAGNTIDHISFYYAGFGKEQLYRPISSYPKALTSNRIYIEFEEKLDVEKLNDMLVEFIGYNNFFYPVSLSMATSEDAIQYGYKESQAAEAAMYGLVADIDVDLLVGTFYHAIAIVSIESGETVSSTSYFFKSSPSSLLPKILGINAVDSQTLRIFFDRPISDPSIAGKIFDTTNYQLKSGVFLISHDGVNYDDLTNGFGDAQVLWTEAYRMENILLVRTSQYNAFYSKLGRFEMTVSVADVIPPNEDNMIPFAGNPNLPVWVVVNNVKAISANKIRITFNQPVKITGQFAQIGTSRFDTPIDELKNLTSYEPFNAAQTIWDFSTSSQLESGKTYYLLLDSYSGALTDLSGFVGMAPGPEYRKFAGPNSQ